MAELYIYDITIDTYLQVLSYFFLLCVDFGQSFLRQDVTQSGLHQHASRSVQVLYVGHRFGSVHDLEINFCPDLDNPFVPSDHLVRNRRVKFCFQIGSDWPKWGKSVTF